MLDPFAVAAIRLLCLTGARLREILDARWDQVDLERGILFLSDSKTGRKPLYLSPPLNRFFPPSFVSPTIRILLPARALALPAPT